MDKIPYTDRFTVDYIEFYITNVCNLNCKQCNRYNNYHFIGQQMWDEYKDIYQKWSKRINIVSCSIIGGEPMLNPTLIEWITGIRNLWPDVNIRISTNATRLNNVDNLYDVLKKHDGKTSIDISLHNRNERKYIMSNLRIFLQEIQTINYIKIPEFNIRWKNAYDSIKDITWDKCDTPEDFKNLPQYIQDECINIHHFTPERYYYDNTSIMVKDINDIKVMVNNAWDFHPSALNYDAKNKIFKVNSSDPSKAWEKCKNGMGKCPQFIEGKIYKCSPVKLIKDFGYQFDINLSRDEEKLINNYIPLSISNHDNEINDFFNIHLFNEIPQCTFCPEMGESVRFTATTKKMKIQKRKK